MRDRVRNRPNYQNIDEDYVEEPASKRLKENDDDAYVFEDDADSDEAYIPSEEVTNSKRGRGRPSKSTGLKLTLPSSKSTPSKAAVPEFDQATVHATLEKLKKDTQPGVPVKTVYWFKTKNWNQKHKRKKKPVGTSRALRTMLNNEKDCPYNTSEAAVSLFPKQKYCDITGLHGRYTDPLSQLRYYSLPVYSILSRFKKENIRTEYLELRKASNKIK